MIYQVEFDCETRRERNQRGASMGAVFALNNRVKKQKEQTAAALANLGLPPPQHVVQTPSGAISRPGAVGLVVPNRIEVRLTRIAPGTLDDDGPDDALKNVRDAVARWIGIDDKPGTCVLWNRGAQEKGPANVYRVRIEITDMLAGDDKRVVLAERASEGRAAKSRVKRLANKAKGAKMHTGTKRGGTQVYHAAEGEKAASSAARSKAEAAFAKVTGSKPHRSVCDPSATGKTPIPGYIGPCNVDDMQRPPKRPKSAPAGSEDATPRMLEPCQVHGVARGIVCPGEPSGACVHRRRLAGLASAAARVLPPTKPTGPRKVATTLTDEQAAMRAQARSVACAACGRDAGFECWDLSNHDRQSSLDFEYGVHASRARAAGLPPYPCAADLDAGARPVRWERCPTCARSGVYPAQCECQTCKGVGRMWTWLPGCGAEVWLCLPWLQPICPACLNRDECGKETCICCDRTGHSARGEGPTRIYSRARDVPDPPPEVLRYLTPAEHVAAHGRTVTLRREVFTTRAGRLAWMFRIDGKRG